MLRRISVANFAVAERLELELGPGLTALTGETGSGKTVILEALAFLLGGRGSSTWLRAGAARLEVEGHFDAADIPEPLRARPGASSGGTVKVRRELDAGGRTRAWIDGRPAPAGALAEFGAAFADFHGQHEQQALLKPAARLELLDRYGGLEEERALLARAHADWSAARARLDACAMPEEERRRRAELARLQIDEIDAARLRPGEDEELAERLPRLRNAERLRGLAEQAHAFLYSEEGAAVDRLRRAERALAELAKADPTAAPLLAALEPARAAAEETAREAAAYRDSISSDPAALDALLSRQEALARLQRRHGGGVAEVLEARRRLAEELEGLEGADGRLERARRQAEEAEAALAALCGRVHEARVAAARRLETAARKELSALGFSHASLACSVQLEEGAWGRTGADSVDFLLAPNPGEPARPVQAAASGGELSRVMLALKSALARADRTPFLVFDEIDAGVGGEVARAVGRRLSAAARGRQVLCVTHLAQVACHADGHLHAVKEVSGGRTRARVEALQGDRRLEAVAVMLGGRGATAAGRRHARELLEGSR